MQYACLLLFLLVSLACSAQGSGQPAYDEVVQYYFQHYSHPDRQTNLFISRRPGGYFVEKRIGLETDTIELLYDLARQRYQELSSSFRWEPPWFVSPDRQVVDTIRAAAAFLARTRYLQSELKQVPYYGYPGWYKDVIALYEDTERPLSAWEQNALGRTYFNYSNALLGMGPYPDPTDSFEVPAGRGQLSEAQVNRYLEVIEKELAAYEQLLELDPDFLTDVGPATTKYAHQMTHAFVTLLYFQDEATARQVLRPQLYDPYLLQMGRNLLNSCPPHAILLTWGDADTYPLYFLQAIEGLRTDVILVNQSLGVLSRYQQMVLEGPFRARPLRTLLPPRFFEQVVICYAPLDDQAREILPADTLFTILADTLNYQISPYFPQQNQVDIPTTVFRLPAPADMHIPSGERADAITYRTNTPYLTPERVFWLDLLKANDWQRPLCFTPATLSGSNPPLLPYLVWEGMILRVYPIAPPEEQSNPALLPFHTDRSYQLWMETYDFDTSALVTPLDKEPIRQQALLAAMGFLQQLNPEEDPERVRALGRRLMKLFPHEQVPWDENWLLVARKLATAGDEEAAHLINRIISQD